MVEGRQELYAAFIYILLLCWAPHDAKEYTTPDFCDGIKSEKPLSFLWGVRRHPPSYFFGTIHVPYTRVWDFIPENAKQAFQESDNVFFELDLTNRRTLAALHRCQLMPRGRKLSDILPAKLFLRLKRHLEYVRRMIPRWVTTGQRGRELYAEYLSTTITGNWQRKRPVWVMLMVSSLNEGDIKWRGVPVLDLYLALKASNLKKGTGAVEDVDEQCLPLNGLNLSQVIFALNQTLTRLERIRSGNSNESASTDDLVKHYNCKDMNAFIFNQDASQMIKLPQFSNGSYQSIEEGTVKMIDEYFRKELIDKRNRRMGERVSTILRNNPDKSYFFAFGAGHFLGNQTVLDVVEEGGFQIDHIPPDLKLKDFRKRYRNSKELPHISFIQDFSSYKLNEDDSTLTHILNEQKKMNMQTTSWIQDNARQKQQRNFTELWVRLVPNPTRSSMRKIHEDVLEDIQDPQGSIRVWYGVPSSTSDTMSNYLIVITLVAQSCLPISINWN